MNPRCSTLAFVVAFVLVSLSVSVQEYFGQNRVRYRTF